MKIVQEAVDGLIELSQDEDEYVARLATEIQDLNKSLENGEITESMYKELSNDILELAKVNQLAESIETKVKIDKMIKMVQLVMKFI